MAIYLLAGVIAVFSFNNVFEITKGYAENNFVNRLNRFKLTEYAAKIASGQKVEMIVLYRLPDDRYSVSMPYQIKSHIIWIKRYFAIPKNRRTASIPYQLQAPTLWIKEYFGIPKNIPIVWNKFGENNDICETIEVQPPKIESISLGEMNLEKGLRLLIKHQGTLPVTVFVNGKELPHEVQGDILSVFVPRSELNVNLKVQIENQLTKFTSETTDFELDRNFVNQYKL